jgi:SpoVK/Ycf46/Vps4 family AAA+-type ATPase
MQAELNTLIQAQYPLIYLVTSEEERAEREILLIAQQRDIERKVYVWTLTQGMVEYGQTKAVQHGTASPQMAIEWTVRHQESGIYIFKDLHPFKDSADVTRWLRDAVAGFKGSKKNIILMSPVQQIPIELETEVVVLDFDLPTRKELDRVLSQQLALTPQRSMAAEDRERLLTAALGLTKDEAEKVFRKAYIQRERLTGDEVDIVLAEKKQLIRRNGILEFIQNNETMQEVGGLGELKRWLTQRADAFSESARDYGLPQPKGMLILGVPGCGKSLIAKTTAEMWGLPLLRLDMGRVYDGSTVGRSEANLRAAIKTAESISPCILLIDELEKAFSGAGGSADSDAGTSNRIFGSFLTWMQEKTSPVFVMATANRVERLPSEFLRKGRFDEIFFVDLPTLSEREAVFKIHIRKRKRDPERFDCEELAKVAEGFSGAEIEQALFAAMYDAFAQDREFSQLDFIAAIKATMPLSRTMHEQVAALRDWARQRARPAASSVADYQRMEF